MQPLLTTGLRAESTELRGLSAFSQIYRPELHLKDRGPMTRNEKRGLGADEGSAPTIQQTKNFSIMLNWAKFRIRKALGLEFNMLERKVIEVENIRELRKLFDWDREALLDDPRLDDFDYPEDLNMRRLHDAEVIGTVMANVRPDRALEIGTAEGRTTALMAANSPDTEIYTINIPPGDLARGEGGELTTGALDINEIGAYYREQGCQNVHQILVNTSTWVPDVGSVGVTFIDGCHDAKFVYGDTVKALSISEPGSFILWHDFNFQLVKTYHWIYDVCLGVEELYRTKRLSGRIYHLRDSWVGLYRVSG